MSCQNILGSVPIGDLCSKAPCYDERLVRMLIEKVTVFDDKLTVEFKSGAEIEV